MRSGNPTTTGAEAKADSTGARGAAGAGLRRRSQLTGCAGWVLFVATAAWLPGLAGADASATPTAGVATTVPAGQSEERGERVRLLDQEALQGLVAPIALWPDDVLALLLPVASDPEGLAAAQAFLGAAGATPTQSPPPDWDDRLVALLNYPDAIERLVVDAPLREGLAAAMQTQSPDVLDAIEAYRRQAFTSGLLRSDARTEVSESDGVLTVRPADQTVVYLLDYDPANISPASPEGRLGYLPRRNPVYYFPYPANYTFDQGAFWGVQNLFELDWQTDRINRVPIDATEHPFHGVYYATQGLYYRLGSNVEGMDGGDSVDSQTAPDPTANTLNVGDDRTRSLYRANEPLLDDGTSRALGGFDGNAGSLAPAQGGWRTGPLGTNGSNGSLGTAEAARRTDALSQPRDVAPANRQGELDGGRIVPPTESGTQPATPTTRR